MRGWIIVVMVLLLAVVVSASNVSLCSDTDGGGARSKDAALKVRGEVKYGITTQVDTCLTSEEGVSTNQSKWLKEYFCALDKRESEAYDCVRLGFSGCGNGECTGGASAAQNQSQQMQPVAACGNKILEKDKGEECDPPNKICFGKTKDQYGLCDAICKCKVSGASAAAHVPACGDDVREGTEECEKDDECPDNHVCSSCKCVKQLTAADIEAMKKQAAEAGPSKEIDEKYKVPDTHEVDLTVKNFSEEPGMKAASGIANFFKSIFGWIAALFS